MWPSSHGKFCSNMVKLLVNTFKVYATSFQIVNAYYYYYYFTMLDRQIVCHNKCICFPVLKVTENVLEIDSKACQICK